MTTSAIIGLAIVWFLIGLVMALVLGPILGKRSRGE